MTATALILAAEVLILIALCWASRNSERFGLLEPLLHSDAIVFFLSPVLAVLALAAFFTWKLSLRTAANCTAGIAVAAVLSFAGWLAAITIAFNLWGT